MIELTPASPTPDASDEASSRRGGRHHGPASTGSRRPGLLHRWERFERYELPLGLVLVAAGLLFIFLGWLDASETADVRRQMQSLISGGFGGLAVLLLGAILVLTHVTSRSSRRLEEGFERIADALVEVARLDGATEETATTIELDHVVASSASYHAPWCDLPAGRGDLRQLSPEEARHAGLRPCRVCLPGVER